MKSSEVKKLFEKEKLEKDVLNRIMWDKKLNGNDFSIGYLDRVSRRIVETPYSSITVDGDFFHHDESIIPMHRIREVKHGGEVVWAKRRNG
ncbi:MAG: DUF504 domain-containing protein [Candidatus Altiarchaeota archaeon]